MSTELRALIIEDSADDALLIANELKHGGFQVAWKRVETSSDLRAILSNESWDIALSDYTMPQFSAVDAIKIIREISPDLPCIIVSGTIGEETAVSAMQAGAQDFFVKGRLTRLCAAVRRQLAETENIRQRRKAENELRESEVRRWQEREEALRRETVARQKIEALYGEAREANRLKEEFLHNLSHELRTPMNAVTGWAELLANGACPTEDHPKIFSAIYRNAQAQNKLISDLLDISRIVTGKLEIESGPVELKKVAQAAIESVQLLAQSKNIKMTLNAEPSGDVVSGESSRLQEVVSNLLSNALKFTPSGGRVDIDIRRAGSMVGLRVTDTGEGIDPKFLPYIFDRFRQADGSLTRRHSGLGLGLSIVRYLVELHGGQVEAQSDGIGKGATLTIRFPVRAVQLQHASQDQSQKRKLSYAQNVLHGLRILIVDDSEDSLVLLGFILRRYGAEIISANSGARARELFREKRPDILLCDIEMPDLNGYEVIRQIRKEELGKQSAIPAAALTAHVRPEDVERAKAAGFNLHLAKPVDAKKLVDALVELAGRA